jgi:predicted RNA methylase
VGKRNPLTTVRRRFQLLTKKEAKPMYDVVEIGNKQEESKPHPIYSAVKYRGEIPHKVRSGFRLAAQTPRKRLKL